MYQRVWTVEGNQLSRFSDATVSSYIDDWNILLAKAEYDLGVGGAAASAWCAWAIFLHFVSIWVFWCIHRACTPHISSYFSMAKWKRKFWTVQTPRWKSEKPHYHLEIFPKLSTTTMSTTKQWNGMRSESLILFKLDCLPFDAAPSSRIFISFFHSFDRPLALAFFVESKNKERMEQKHSWTRNCAHWAA